jgi:DNA-binding response OmpR family regulator
MTPRILLVTEERELRDWMRHHLDILWPEATVTDMPVTRFSAGLLELNLLDFDLIALSANCGEEDADPGAGLDLLRAAMAVRGCPPMIVIAQGGNELSAAEAMRTGAADYLPRSLINAQRMANALRIGLRAPRRGRIAERRRMRRPQRLDLDPDTLDLPQYSLLHKLGESSRAAVYLAYSATLGRNVALKISKPSIDPGEECQEFAREYAAISALRNPAIVDI